MAIKLVCEINYKGAPSGPLAQKCTFIIFFEEAQYPANPSFEFIGSENTRNMIATAYDCICRHEKWEILYNFFVDETRGFMFTNSDEINELMTLIEHDSKIGHSGCSFAFTMRNLHFIARYGYPLFAKTCTRSL